MRSTKPLGSRAQIGLIHVGLLVVTVLVALWVYAVIGPAILEPIHDIASSNEAVQEEGHQGRLDTILAVTLNHAPKLLGVGIILLAIIFAAFRERFVGRTRRPP